MRLHHFVHRLAVNGGDPFATAAAINPGVVAGGLAPQSTGESALPGMLPRAGGDPVEQVGTAIYSRDRLVGFLNVDETQMLLALRGEMGKAYMTFPDPDTPGAPVTMRFHQENLPKYWTEYRGNRPHVHVSLPFEGEVLAIPGGTDYVRAGARERLEAAAAEFAEQTLRQTLQKLHDWNSDPVAFGLIFRNQFGSYDEWEDFDWRRPGQSLNVDVAVDIRIRRFGLFTGPDRAYKGR